MKLFITMSAIAAFAFLGCTTDDDYSGASDPAFSTPSWGTSSETARPMLPETEPGQTQPEQRLPQHQITPGQSQTQ